MAKRKRGRKGRRRLRGLGSTIIVRKLGVGAIDRPDSMTGALMPVLIGGGVTFLVTAGLQQMPTTPDNAAIKNNAQWIGFGAGALSGLALWNLARPASGVMAVASALVATLATTVPTWISMARLKAESAGARTGTGAVVPEYSMRGLGGGHGVGAIVMQPQAMRAAGETVSLSGVNTSVFGTPAFRR